MNNSTEINCYLLEPVTEKRTFSLTLPIYTDLIHQIRQAYKDMLNYDQIKVFWMNNSSQQLLIINNDHDLYEAIKEAKMLLPTY